MIFDSLKNRQNYSSIPGISQALEFLASLAPGALPDETVRIDGDNLFANPVALTSKPEKDCVFEAHQKYIDLHYIVEGTEEIATAHADALKVRTPYDPDKDIGFYDGQADGAYFLKPGQFMVCWPSDAHKVAMAPQGVPGSIKKMVVKIKA